MIDTRNQIPPTYFRNLNRRARVGTATYLLGLFLLCVFSFGLAGCNRGPKTIKAPKIDANSAASKAMELFDADQNGFLTGEELESSPGLKTGLKTVDKNGDGKISEDEISQRISAWADAKIGSLPVSCSVTLNGRPLDEADVTFEPEPFLEGLISPARGTTDLTGTTELSCKAVPFGTQVGFYRVLISKLDGTKETLPGKYNVQTILGAEVSNQSPGILAGRYLFSL